MLFNSYEFIWLFLPITWAGFFLAAKFRNELAAAWLALCSLFFYGYWDPHYVPLLLFSITVNYQIGKHISAHVEQQQPAVAKRWLLAGLAFDLGLLAYYKYTGFFLSSWVDLTDTNLSIPEIILPLGISFFTFTQIAYLADCHKGIVRERNPVHYLLFITYFPHLIAGPVLHHKQMMPQFAYKETYRINAENIAVGLTIFAIGMFKKVVLADSLAEYANPIFAVHKHHGALSTQEAWLGSLAYTIQLYFDFSGYSDMAIGLSRLFGIRLPINFDSPYKSTSIIDFWRRWHMTLSQFLSQYLYIAVLGGNRLGKVRRHVNLMLTMLLGGLWHGAGWTYVIWGGLHGLFLVTNHIFREYFPVPDEKNSPITARLRSLVGWLLTILCVSMALVVFRSHTIHDAVMILRAMAGLVPDNMQAVELIDHADDGWNWIIFTAMIILFTPNTQTIMSHYKPATDEVSPSNRWVWQPTAATALITSLVLAYSILNIGQVSEFLYFQF